MTEHKLYHHVFAPWTVGKDGTRIVAKDRSGHKLLVADDHGADGDLVQVNCGEVKMLKKGGVK